MYFRLDPDDFDPSDFRDYPAAPDLIERVECEEQGTHLTSCDEDGYCNFCGEQD